MKYPLIFIIPFFLLGVTACKKMDNSALNSPITNEESANMIAGSLASGSNGLTSFSTDMTVSSQTLYSNSTGCGATHIDSVYHKSLPGAAIAYNFKYRIANKLNCNSKDLPDNITSNLTFTGNYNSPKVITNGTGSISATIAGLTPSSAVYAINGEFKNTSTFKLKSDTTRNGTIAVDIVVKNLVIAKGSTAVASTITSGTATATITGNSPKGAFLFVGNLTFTGNDTASLIWGGTTYNIDLLTGTITK